MGYGDCKIATSHCWHTLERRCRRTASPLMDRGESCTVSYWSADFRDISFYCQPLWRFRQKIPCLLVLPTPLQNCCGGAKLSLQLFFLHRAGGFSGFAGNFILSMVIPFMWCRCIYCSEVMHICMCDADGSISCQITMSVDYAHLCPAGTIVNLKCFRGHCCACPGLWPLRAWC